MKQDVLSPKEETGVEFEEVNGILTSRSFKSMKGGPVTIFYINERSAIMQSSRESLTVQVNGPIKEIISSATAKSFLGGLWDKVKGVVGAIVDGILDGGSGGSGGSGQCSQSGVNVTVNVSGNNNTLNPNSVNVNVQCQGPQ